MSILINQLDDHNEANIMASINNNIQKVVFLYTKDQMALMESLAAYYKLNFSKIEVELNLVNIGDTKQLNEIVSRYEGKELIVNLTGGKRINSLILLNICREKNIQSIYIDIKNKISYKFADQITFEEAEIKDLDIDSIIKTPGGKVIEDSSDLCKKDDLVYLSKEIYHNLNLWNKHKLKLYDSSIIKHDEIDSSKIYIIKDKLNEEDLKLLFIVLEKLKEMNELFYKELKSTIEIKFLNDYIKGFIFKSGTWLEIATNNLINKIKEIDESKNGLIFLWNNENRTVRNELDVVAVKDSVTICISCKDSDKYNEMALNELNVYANKIGGKSVYKILVATKEPVKLPVKTRAKEMGINLVIFDGDEEKFIRSIRAIINGE